MFELQQTSFYYQNVLYIGFGLAFVHQLIDFVRSQSDISSIDLITHRTAKPWLTSFSVISDQQCLEILAHLKKSCILVSNCCFGFLLFFFTLKAWKASNWMLGLLSLSRFIISLRFSGLLM